MDIAVDRLEFSPPATPGLLRSLGLALLAHAFLIAALTWGVHWRREAVRVSVEAELWSALPQAAAPKLVAVAPEPPVAPVPAPPQAEAKRPDADIVLERDKPQLKKELELKKQHELEQQRMERQRLEQIKQEKLALEKKRLQDKHDQDKKAAEEKKKTAEAAQRKEALLTQQEAKKMEILHKANVDRMTGLAGATGAPNSTGTAPRSSGPSASYAGRIRARIRPNIVFTDTISGNPVAEVEVQTAPDGTIVSRKLTQASGVKSWDDAVLKAIDKTVELPRDLDGRVPPVLTISFRPKD